jgi:GAF domain-containing protein
VIPDVTADPLFAGTPAGAVLSEAGVRAVQSTPLVTAGEVLGMISTHYTAPHALTEKESDVLDHIARRAAFWLDGGVLSL